MLHVDDSLTATTTATQASVKWSVIVVVILAGKDQGNNFKMINDERALTKQMRTVLAIGTKMHTIATIRHAINVFKMLTNNGPNVIPMYV